MRTFFAIRRKSDGAYIPIRVGKRGQTASEPSKTEPPRLFTRRSSAASALKWWLAGVHYMVRTGGYGQYTGAGDPIDYDEELRLAPVEPENPPRVAADFEIVRVAIRVDRSKPC